MTKEFHVTEKVAEGGFIVLEYDDEPFKGVQWTYGAMKIGDHENEDGSMNLSFDYDIQSEHQLNEEETSAFGQCIGEVLYQILEEQAAKGEVQYAGGTNEGLSEVIVK